LGFLTKRGLEIMRSEYVYTNDRGEAKELCPWATYMSKAVDGYWMFDGYEAWAAYEFN
jgi:hypothetical protein